MISSLHVDSFSVFKEAKLEFAEHLNVFVGESGAGKTHLLKLAYSVLATTRNEARKLTAGAPTRSVLKARIAEKLVNVFRPESLGHLAGRRQGQERCAVTMRFARKAWDMRFSFSTRSKSEVAIDTLPAAWADAPSAYLPTQDLRNPSTKGV